MTEKLDKKDRKILYQLDINCRQSNAEIGKKVGLSKEVVNYRIQRLEKRGIIQWYGSVINTYKLGFQKFKLYIKLQNANSEKRKEIIAFLVDRKKTEWVALCEGRWDIIVGLIVRSISEFKKAVDEIFELHSEYFEEKQTTITYGAPHSCKDWLVPEEQSPHPPMFQGGDHEYTPDKTEEELLRIITNNARIPIVDLAKRLKVTPRIASYKLKNLKKKGIIMLHRVFLDLSTIGMIYGKTFIYLKNQSQEKLNKLISYCDNHPNSTYNVVCIGSWDLEPEWEVQSFDEFSKEMKKIRDLFAPIIRKMEFLVIEDEVKLDYFPGCYKAFPPKTPSKSKPTNRVT